MASSASSTRSADYYPAPEFPDQSGPLPGKDIVLCFDGTASRFGHSRPSNVLKLYQMLSRDSEQINYYQPGIGTYIGSESDDSISSKYRSFLLALDSVIAYSFDDHIIAGYRFLLRYFSAGDRIWLFGFSRGAFTARVLASLVSCVGILDRGGEELVPCAWEIYKNWEAHGTPEDPRCRATALVNDFKRSFASQMPDVYFLGLWDSIDSVGLLRNRNFLKSARAATLHLRHALSIDERRSTFRHSSIATLNHKSSRHSEDNSGYWFPTEDENENDVVERWFPGNHGDVGGGCWPREDERGLPQLADVSLLWMVYEARALGLSFADDAIAALSSRSSSTSTRDIIAAKAHDMLSFTRDKGKGRATALKWWAIELLPWPYVVVQRDGRQQRKWAPNLGRRRKIPGNATMHWAVKVKTEGDAGYRPRNVPASVRFEGVSGAV
ncbi:hypothetical protein BZA70DRAFT_283984 [Myxozyma melibiosi]|uniref:T6SS Phospholipase effector Tle1-like catalytic domain-containing protein n=1 Tax=Myxozyma melibiosi TaxID=54550 RepID=A0ABR1F243_9ASCO